MMVISFLLEIILLLATAILGVSFIISPFMGGTPIMVLLVFGAMLGYIVIVWSMDFVIRVDKMK